MRVAALHDVHGNLPALEAVLSELEREPVDAIVAGGDVVWGPLPVECVALLRERGARFLRGNCERDVLARVTDFSAWCDDRLDDEARRFLSSLPITISLDGVLYCHATPRSDEEIITTATPDDVVDDAFAGIEAGLVVAGHTHRQLDRRAGATRLVNAGSVGLPYEGVAAAFWALVEDGEVEPRTTQYDVPAALDRLRASGAPEVDEFLHESLIEPASPDDVAAHFERRAGRGA